MVIFQTISLRGPNFYLSINKTRPSYYMFPLAFQTTGPNGLKFVEGTHGYPGGDIGQKQKTKKFSSNFFPRSTAGPSASFYYYPRFIKAVPTIGPGFLQPTFSFLRFLFIEFWVQDCVYTLDFRKLGRKISGGSEFRYDIK